jgi:SAM-dependent methyltransferase
VNEILHILPEGAVVLDLGCGRGSFDAVESQFTIVRVDLEPHRAPNFVQADAARMPVRANSVDLVVSNNSLEHFENLTISLEEIGRVLKSNGYLYVAVPDVTTITDRLYRWLARGGGHVNPFSSAQELAFKIERATGLSHIATRTLCSSLSFLNRRNRRTRAPKRLWLLGGGTQTSLLLLTYAFRLLDRILGTRLSVYGWALYFGNIQAAIDCNTWTNVCILCGAGHPSDRLLREQMVVPQYIVSLYRCPNCRTLNLFTDDKRYQHLTTE